MHKYRLPCILTLLSVIKFSCCWFFIFCFQKDPSKGKDIYWHICEGINFSSVLLQSQWECCNSPVHHPLNSKASDLLKRGILIPFLQYRESDSKKPVSSVDRLKSSWGGGLKDFSFSCLTHFPFLSQNNCDRRNSETEQLTTCVLLAPVFYDPCSGDLNPESYMLKKNPPV